MSSGVVDDGLDPLAWDIVAKMVIAAHEVNRVAFRAAANGAQRHVDQLREETEFPGIQYGRYLYYLLWREMARIVDRAPELEDVPRIAEIAWPKYSLLTRSDRPHLESMLADVIVNREDRQKGPTGTDFILLSPVAIGALMYNPSDQLARLRPLLAGWYGKTFGGEESV
jgi:hypothetical protein